MLRRRSDSQRNSVKCEYVTARDWLFEREFDRARPIWRGFDTYWTNLTVHVMREFICTTRNRLHTRVRHDIDASVFFDQKTDRLTSWLIANFEVSTWWAFITQVITSLSAETSEIKSLASSTRQRGITSSSISISSSDYGRNTNSSCVFGTDPIKSVPWCTYDNFKSITKDREDMFWNVKHIWFSKILICICFRDVLRIPQNVTLRNRWIKYPDFWTFLQWNLDITSLIIVRSTHLSWMIIILTSIPFWRFDFFRSSGQSCPLDYVRPDTTFRFQYYPDTARTNRDTDPAVFRTLLRKEEEGDYLSSNVISSSENK